MRLASLFLCLFTSPLFAQSVTLPAEIKGAPGSWIIVAPDAVDGGVVKWRIDPGLQEVKLDKLLPPETAALLKGKVVTGPAGVYKLEAWNAKGDVASDISICWIRIGDGSNPTPGPGPGPTPEPKPAPTKITAVILEESAARTPAIASIIASTSLRKALTDQGHGVRLYDKDVGEGKKWLAYVTAKNIQLPAVIMAETSTSKIRDIQPLPLTEEAFILLTKKAAGE